MKSVKKIRVISPLWRPKGRSWVKGAADRWVGDRFATLEAQKNPTVAAEDEGKR